MAAVAADKIAQALNLSEQRVHQLVKEGLPKEGRGQYDPVKCMLWYIRYLQQALEKKAVPTLDGGFVGEREERVRLLRADADLREMELARERGLVVAIQDVEKEMTDLILTTKARVMAVAPRLAADIVGETSRVMAHAKIEKALKEALLGLSKREVKSHAEKT
jgi:phage terminase Nu1 subunit (DNA packaging protein)